MDMRLVLYIQEIRVWTGQLDFSRRYAYPGFTIQVAGTAVPLNNGWHSWKSVVVDGV